MVFFVHIACILDPFLHLMIDKNCGALGINCISAPAAGHSRKSLRTTRDRQGPEITRLERLDWPVSKTHVQK